MTGKKIGKDNVYIHRSAIGELPLHLQTRVVMAAILVVKSMFNRKGELKDITSIYNFIITHPNYIEFVVAENFDTIYEPVLGRRYRVDTEGLVTVKGRPAKPRILHQRYKTVKGDYEGFDLELDMAREMWYRAHFSGRDMAGAGFEHKWVSMIDKIGGFIEESHR
jgi:hypothetical protein